MKPVLDLSPIEKYRFLTDFSFQLGHFHIKSLINLLPQLTKLTARKSQIDSEDLNAIFTKSIRLRILDWDKSTLPSNWENDLILPSYVLNELESFTTPDISPIGLKYLIKTNPQIRFLFIKQYKSPPTSLLPILQLTNLEELEIGNQHIFELPNRELNRSSWDRVYLHIRTRLKLKRFSDGGDSEGLWKRLTSFPTDTMDSIASRPLWGLC